jgi:hypothetical protein
LIEIGVGGSQFKLVSVENSSFRVDARTGEQRGVLLAPHAVLVAPSIVGTAVAVEFLHATSMPTTPGAASG